MEKLVIIIMIFIVLGANGQTLQQEINNTKTDLKPASTQQLDASLDVLVSQIGDKRIIALGEDTHGTKEFYELRNAITQKLIKEKGFNMIILENPYEDMEVLSKELQTKPLDTLIQKHLFPIYQTKEMKDFLIWLKKYNQTHIPIPFKGCDDSYREILPKLLSKELQPHMTTVIKEMLNEFKLRVDLQAEEFYAKFPAKQKGKIDDYIYNNELYRLILRLEKEIEKEHIISKQLEELVFNAKNTYINDALILEGKIRTRDILMAERIAFLAKKSNAKIIIWAHNAHISKEVIIDNEIGLMGRNLKKEFPNEYLAVGMSSLSGTYSYIKNRFINGDHDYKDQLYISDYPMLPTNTFEEKLGNSTSKAYYFPINKSIQEIYNKQPKQKLKLFGYMKNTEKDYYEVNPAIMYDIIVFMSKTTHTTPLFKYAE